jgi:hypothetical protein
MSMEAEKCVPIIKTPTVEHLQTRVARQATRIKNLRRAIKGLQRAYLCSERQRSIYAGQARTLYNQLEKATKQAANAETRPVPGQHIVYPPMECLLEERHSMPPEFHFIFGCAVTVLLGVILL